jgi:hypothetical protein
LFDGKKRMTEVSGGHTFYLEELNVKPGRFRVVLREGGRQRFGSGSQPAMSDIVLCAAVRPLSKEFRRAPSDAEAAAEAAAEGGQVGALSEQQRQIIAGDIQRAARSARR